MNAKEEEKEEEYDKGDNEKKDIKVISLIHKVKIRIIIYIIIIMKKKVGKEIKIYN